MKKHSKRFQNLQNSILQEQYTIDNALKIVKEISTARFCESIEAHIALNLDPKYQNQQLRTSLILPNGTGKQKKIAVFTESENIEEIKNYGAYIVGGEDLLEQINKGNLDFDILITTPNLMPKLAKIGKILGPKGLMPSPKSGTVTNNLKETIIEFRKGKIEYRADKMGIVHLIFGNKNFSIEQLMENLFNVYNSIEKNKPIGVKGKYFKSIFICATMSPSIQIDLASFK